MMMLLSIIALCPLPTDQPSKGPSSSIINLMVHTKAMADFTLSDYSISWSKIACASSLQVLFHFEKQLLKIMEAEGIL